MSTLAHASLTDGERRVLDHFVAALADALGERLRSVWLYGSRARGEPPQDESDIDVLLVVDPLLDGDSLTATRLSWDAVDAEGPVTGLISTFVFSAERVARRRAIESFFIQEVDRDKIVLFGEP